MFLSSGFQESAAKGDDDPFLLNFLRHGQGLVTRFEAALWLLFRILTDGEVVVDNEGRAARIMKLIKKTRKLHLCDNLPEPNLRAIKFTIISYQLRPKYSV